MTKLLETGWGFTVFGVTGSMEPVRKIPKNYRNVAGIVASFKAEGPTSHVSAVFVVAQSPLALESTRFFVWKRNLRRRFIPAASLA